jgi:hypothetical protein
MLIWNAACALAFIQSFDIAGMIDLTVVMSITKGLTRTGFIPMICFTVVNDRGDGAEVSLLVVYRAKEF